jgi:hypothetical protein
MAAGGGYAAGPRFADHGRETVAALLDLAETLAEDKFLNHYKASDAKSRR